MSRNPKTVRPAGGYKFDERAKTLILESLRLGSSLRGAAGHAGISFGTLHEWITFGRAGDERYSAFAADVEVARQGWEVAALQKIHAAASAGTWTAAAWLLERRIPRLYARAQLADLIERGVQARMEQEIARAKQLNADQAAGLASAEPTEAVPLDEIAAELADDPTDPE